MQPAAKRAKQSDGFPQGHLRDQGRVGKSPVTGTSSLIDVREGVCSELRRYLSGAPLPTDFVVDLDNNQHKMHEFEQKGYVTFSRFLTREAVARLRQEYDAIMEDVHDSIHPEWVLSLHQMLPSDNNWMLQLATHPKLVKFVQQQLGPDVVLFSSQLAYKPPGGGKRVPWHQDGERCRTIWINLDAVDEMSGGLSVIPCGHKKGRRKYRKFEPEEDITDPMFFSMHHLFECETTASERVYKEHIRLPAGSLEMHNPLTPHSSQPNLSQRPRRVIILRYQPISEPLVGGTVRHWRTGKEMQKKNFLVAGTLDEGKEKPAAGETGQLKR